MHSDSEIQKQITRCAALLEKTHGLLVITGAGISTESGMPTYRGPGGLYEQNPEITSILSIEGLANEPHKLWEHIDEAGYPLEASSRNGAYLCG
jgi:NAD-dependent SIR2 family protein deacetylase